MDEEGMEVAVCRHGFLLKALNMYRGEIFAYPLYLQKELMPAKPQFFAMDVACKYWPYLEKAASVLPALQELTKMKPFLSVMHARAHATKCEVFLTFLCHMCICNVYKHSNNIQVYEQLWYVAFALTLYPSLLT